MEARKVFRDHGLRCTRQREMLYDALRATDSHPTAEELHALVHRADPGISLATVYNTLDAFVRTGLAQMTPGGAGPCRYDADTTEHVHVVLPDGRVVDLAPDLGREVLERLPRDLLERVAEAAGAAGSPLRVHLLAGSAQPAQESPED